MTGTVSRGCLSELERRREQIRAAAENMLLEARAAGREQLNAGETHRHAQAMADLRGLDEHIEQIRADLERADLGRYAHLGTTTTTTTTLSRRPTVSTHIYEPATYQRANYIKLLQSWGAG